MGITSAYIYTKLLLTVMVGKVSLQKMIKLKLGRYDRTFEEVGYRGSYLYKVIYIINFHLGYKVSKIFFLFKEIIICTVKIILVGTLGGEKSLTYFHRFT